MSTDDYQELTTMSTKEFHALSFWRKLLIECCKDQGSVTAGQVAKAAGQSRNTAKKYLNRLVAEKCAATEPITWHNGIEATLYYPLRKASQS